MPNTRWRVTRDRPGLSGTAGGGPSMNEGRGAGALAALPLLPDPAVL